MVKPKAQMMLQILVGLIAIGYSSCNELELTYEYGGSIYTVYKNVSHSYSDAIQYCKGHGHDGLADLCETGDLTKVLPSTNGKPLFWITGPQTCNDLGNCMSLWYGISNFPGWVVMCATCETDRNFICQSSNQTAGSPASTVTPTTDSTTPRQSSPLSVCTDKWNTQGALEYVVIPLVLSYVKAEQLCQSRYQGDILPVDLAETELSAIMATIGTFTVPGFWLKEKGPDGCNLLNSSGIEKNATTCSFVYGSICYRKTGNFSRRLLSVTNHLLEATYTHQETIRNSLSTSGLMAVRKARSLVDCASFCSVDTTCRSFFFVSESRLCQIHNITISGAFGQLKPAYQAKYYTKND